MAGIILFVVLCAIAGVCLICVGLWKMANFFGKALLIALGLLVLIFGIAVGVSGAKHIDDPVAVIMRDGTVYKNVTGDIRNYTVKKMDPNSFEFVDGSWDGKVLRFKVSEISRVLDMEKYESVYLAPAVQVMSESEKETNDPYFPSPYTYFDSYGNFTFMVTSR